jgi:hypothetical protein
MKQSRERKNEKTARKLEERNLTKKVKIIGNREYEKSMKGVKRKRGKMTMGTEVWTQRQGKGG